MKKIGLTGGSVVEKLLLVRFFKKWDMLFFLRM